MLKHHESLSTHDQPDDPRTLEMLPELPGGIIVPDDARDLMPPQRRPRLVRWGWWTAAAALLAGASVYVVVQVLDDTNAAVDAPAPAEVSAYDLKQQTIDERVARLERLPDVKEYYVELNEARIAAQTSEP